MSDDSDAEAAARRLELALERIATLAQRPPAPGVMAAPVANPADSPEAGAGQVDAGALAARLDALIADVRGALAG